MARQKTLTMLFFFPLFLAEKVSSFDRSNQIAVKGSLRDVSRIMHGLVCFLHLFILSYKIFFNSCKSLFSHLESFSSPSEYVFDMMNAVPKVKG